MNGLTLTGIVAGVAALAWAATGLARRFLLARAILDHPNARSSHEVPTPRGGGLGVMIAVFAGWAAMAALDLPTVAGPVIGAGAFLLAVSWIDDLKGLPAGPRFAVQVLCVAVALAVSGKGPYFGGLLPPAVDWALAGIGWVWFINLYNFMDGIDGITGVETAGIVGGLLALAAIVPGLAGPAAAGLALLGAVLGFLVWNWPPARIFLGDVGSVPLGFFVGWLLLETARLGQPVPALILALYYLADATLTLGRRALRGEKPWQAHRKHFYQQATRKGWSHARVSLTVLGCNLLLVACAVAAALGHPGAGLATAAAVVAATLWLLHNPTDPEWAFRS